MSIDAGAIARRRAEVLAAIERSDKDLADDPRLALKVDFFLSSIVTETHFDSIEDILAWLEELRTNNDNLVELIGTRELDKWYIEEGTGNIRHETGRFFSIEGVKVETQGREVRTWQQPIINQPEVGILGIIVTKIDGLYYFLMQAKTEPGNIDGYQLSPTVQATHSNYTKVHGGKLPPFVEVFLDRENPRYRVIFEGLQSEEGARFWKKNNLNVILEVDQGQLGEVPPEFRWMTLFQLKQLLLRPNVINICARSVLACVP